MKILIVSMRSIHTIRWVSQLKDSGHELYYFDILNGGYIDDWDNVQQHTNWRYKFGDFKGRYLLKNTIPSLHKLLENNVEKEFEKVLIKFKPDVVHSFVMYSCCVPIFEVMKKKMNVKWIYSAWGNDLFYYKNLPEYKRDIERVLPYIDYMFADCKRDLKLAVELGLGGKVLGNFPGGGGYQLEKYLPYYKNFSERKKIIVKGYEQRFGKCSIVLKALQLIQDKLFDYQVVVFGADKELLDYLSSSPIDENIQIEQKMSHDDVLKLMGEALIYIGNSISDGMPNTMLEAIVMGAFPIQSNPGGATAEIIDHERNGLLIENPENPEEIADHILEAINNQKMLKEAISFNKEISQNIAFEKIQKGVLNAYMKVENSLD